MTNTYTERQLIQFRETFRHKNCTVYADSVVYKCPDGWANGMAEDANALIKRLNLPLVAIPTTLMRKDSFYVKALE